MMIKLDGRWLNPELVELLEEDGIANTLVTFTSGANVILQAMDPDKVAELLNNSGTAIEVYEPQSPDGRMHYSEKWDQPTCYADGQKQFDVWLSTSDFSKVGCRECIDIVKHRRGES